MSNSIYLEIQSFNAINKIYYLNIAVKSRLSIFPFTKKIIIFILHGQTLSDTFINLTSLFGDIIL